MNEIVYRDLYRTLLIKFNLGETATELLNRVIAGSEKADDYEEILRKDKFFTQTICRQASSQMKTSAVSSIGHGVVLVGQEHIRNMVLNHTLDRTFKLGADTSFEGIETSEKSLKYAILAEDHARKCRNEYGGLALAAGYIFDIFSNWIAKDPFLQEKLQPFFESNWRHGMRTASVAWAIASHPRILVSFRKLIFAAGLLHDIGKLGLAVYKPDIYLPIIDKMRELRQNYPMDDMYEEGVERESLDLTHAEIGSAILFQTKFLREVEMEVDFHHDISLLKLRNPDAFLGAAILNVADRVAWMSEQKPDFGDSELREIMKPHASYLPLKAQDILDVYVEVRSRGLLV